MGSFFGSIHVRTTDYEAVRYAAEAAAHKHGLKWMLAPTIDGWTSLYPSGHGQDEQPTHTLATLLPKTDLVHVVLHDDDVFAYGFFRHGKLLDEYNSDPDYFGEVPPTDHERQRGRPERFADLLGSAHASVESLLRTRSGDATALFEEFAKLLHLPNAATSYEYLIDGETDGVSNFKEFVVVPDPSAERATKKAQQAALKALKKELQSAGVLLAEFSGGKGEMFAPRPLFCPIGRSDFLICWPQFNSVDPCELLRVGPADWRSPSLSRIQLDSRVCSLSASPSGRYVAAMYASGTWVSELWDLPARTRIATIDHRAHAAAEAVFSSDDSLLLIRSEDQIHCVRTEDGFITYRVDLQDQGRLIAIHPTAPYAIVDASGQPTIIDLVQHHPVRRLLIGGRHDLARDIATQMQWQLEAQSDPATKEILKARLDDALRSVGMLNPDERRGNEFLHDLAFSTDGHYLLIATDKGARAYHWSSVLAASENMPDPVFAAEAERVTYQLRPGHDHMDTRATAVVYDPHQHRMLFTGIEGKVYSVDLETGQQRTILSVPGRPPVAQMRLSGDASALVLGFTTVHFERSPKTPWWLQFWRYPLANTLGHSPIIGL